MFLFFELVNILKGFAHLLTLFICIAWEGEFVNMYKYTFSARLLKLTSTASYVCEDSLMKKCCNFN